MLQVPNIQYLDNFTFRDAFGGGSALIFLLEAAQEVFTSEGR